MKVDAYRKQMFRDHLASIVGDFFVRFNTSRDKAHLVISHRNRTGLPEDIVRRLSMAGVQTIVDRFYAGHWCFAGQIESVIVPIDQVACPERKSVPVGDKELLPALAHAWDF